MIDAQQVLSIPNMGGGMGERETFYNLKGYVLPSVDANDDSDTIRFRVGEFSSITSIRMYCESINYTATLYDKKECAGFNQLLQFSEVDKFYSQVGAQGVYFLNMMNRDLPIEPYMYLTISNKDTSTATGPIQIEFMLAQI
jgi:hypothetical protein